MRQHLIIGVISSCLTALLFSFSVSAQKTTQRRYINVDRNPALQGLPFSNAVLVGDTLYLSGRIGLDPKTGKPPAEAETEARIAMDSLRATLKEAGMTMDDLVMVQVSCPEISNYPAFNAVYRTYFKKDFPARAFLGSGPLLFGGRFEVLGIAVRR